MAAIIDVEDLPTSVQSDEMVQVMVDGANAMASRVAPCLDDDPTPEQLAEARLVLIGAVIRWATSGAGAVTQQTAGPFSMSTDTRNRSGYTFWPSEIDRLQDICKGDSDAGGAFQIDTTPPHPVPCPSWWVTPDEWEDPSS